jgi:RNA polymerase sigma factor (sigma-70 family)
MMSEQSDFDLLDRWGTGDLAAGSALFARHFDALYSFLRRRAIGAVDDLAQEALLACVENRARFRREANFRTYLLQIARYRVYAHYQRNGCLSGASIESAAAAETSPTGRLVRKQDERLVLHALRRIPSDFQIVLKLSFFDDLSGPEIAELLQIPEPTVRTRIWRALKRLKRETTLLAADASGMRETPSELHHWAERIRHVFEALPSAQ